jgi:hypothetical protein
VGGAVATAAGASPASTLCAPLYPTGIGPWSCTYQETATASTRPARITVGEDGFYSGVYTDGRGIEQPIAPQCCIGVTP